MLTRARSDGALLAEVAGGLFAGMRPDSQQAVEVLTELAEGQGAVPPAAAQQAARAQALRAAQAVHAAQAARATLRAQAAQLAAQAPHADALFTFALGDTVSNQNKPRFLALRAACPEGVWMSSVKVRRVPDAWPPGNAFRHLRAAV